MGTYETFVDQYKQYHATFDGGRQSGYSGRSILKQLKAIRTLAHKSGAKTALDYGCGRGEQYSWTDIEVEGEKVGSLREYFGLDSVTLFDPAVPAHMQRPTSEYDLVICTDVLEHIHKSDVDWVLRDIIGFSRKAVFLSIANYKAGTLLPNGENAHTTIENLSHWSGRIKQAKASRTDLRINLVVKHKIKFANKLKLKWERTATL
jgi:hypothetical protein